MTKYTNLDEMIFSNNSCTFDMNQKLRGGIRVRVN